MLYPKSMITQPFQSTLPVWGATYTLEAKKGMYIISIHAPRVGSDAPVFRSRRGRGISIHAPRVGSDDHI